MHGQYSDSAEGNIILRLDKEQDFYVAEWPPKRFLHLTLSTGRFDADSQLFDVREFITMYGQSEIPFHRPRSGQI